MLVGRSLDNLEPKKGDIILWKLGPFRRGQWLSLDPPFGSVIEYNVCIVYSVFYLLRCPNFFCTKRKMENWFSLHPWERIYSVWLFRASDISRKKKAKFRGIFGGKFAEKAADFTGFSREKSQNSPENRLISRDFSGTKSNFEGFSGANS